MTNSGHSHQVWRRENTALIAVAHALLKLIYEVLSAGQPYQDRNVLPLTPTQTGRLIHHDVRRLGELGVHVRHAQLSDTGTRRRKKSVLPDEPNK